jgi:hypothetical protein
MKYTKVQLLSALIGVGAFADTVFTLLTDNASLLIDIGFTVKVVSDVKLTGLIVEHFQLH